MGYLAEVLRLALLTCIGTAIILLVLSITGCGLNGHGLIPSRAGPAGGSIHCAGAHCETRS